MLAVLSACVILGYVTLDVAAPNCVIYTYCQHFCSKLNKSNCLQSQLNSTAACVLPFISDMSDEVHNNLQKYVFTKRAYTELTWLHTNYLSGIFSKQQIKDDQDSVDMKPDHRLRR